MISCCWCCNFRLCTFFCYWNFNVFASSIKVAVCYGYSDWISCICSRSNFDFASYFIDFCRYVVSILIFCSDCCSVRICNYYTSSLFLTCWVYCFYVCIVNSCFLRSTFCYSYWNFYKVYSSVWVSYLNCSSCLTRCIYLWYCFPNIGCSFWRIIINHNPIFCIWHDSLVSC